MVGTGKSNKKLYVNIGEEDVDFKTEATTYYALSGNLKNMPDFTPGFEPIKIPSHTTYGEKRTTKQGKSNHKITLPYADIVDWRFLAHIFGGRLDQPHILETASGNATEFVDNELITAAGGAMGRIDDVDAKDTGAVDIPLLKFAVGDSVTGVTSSAIGTIISIKGTIMLIKVTSGVFTVGGEEIKATVSESTSAYTVASAIATSGSIATATITLFINSEVVTGAGGGTGTIGSDGIITQHDLFVQNTVASKSMEYVHESLNTIAQHLLTGCACDKVEVKGVAGTAPVEGTVTYNAAHYEKDTTVGPEVAVDCGDDIYEYTQVDFNIDGVPYEGKAKAFTLTFDRGHASIDTFEGVDPEGFGSGLFVSTVSFEIHKENFDLTDLMIANTDFIVTVPMIRGNAGEDEVLFTYSSCSLYNEPITEGENTILGTIAPEVNGVPTVRVRDKKQNYN